MADQSPLHLKLALPSKGALEQPSLDFLNHAGLRVHKPNRRQYSAKIPALPDVEVVFQRASDIVIKVQEGSVDLGITGYDIFHEVREEYDPVIVIDRLGFGRCELVVAVPDSWVDVSTIADLADLCASYKARGREMRIVTKYPNTTRDWLYSKGIIHFTLVNADGALEAAPDMGYADIIVDLTETGTTLRENRLKTITNGTLLYSEAVLIGNTEALSENPGKLETTRCIVEFIEAQTRARQFVSVTANVFGDSADNLVKRILEEPGLAGSVGPGVTRVHPKSASDNGWFEVNILVERRILMAVITHLRRIGGTDISVLSPDYVFTNTSNTFERLLENLHAAKGK